MDTACPFCNTTIEINIETKNVIAVLDKYPVTKFHTLLVPKRHVSSFFKLTIEEQQDCLLLLQTIKESLSKSDNTISGFNVGINDGKDAGQTIPHCHIHLIPRRKGDVKNPRGGVRHVIPDKGNYDTITSIDIQEEKFKTISA